MPIKIQFWDPLSFEHSPRAHTHSDPIINTHTAQVRKICTDLPVSWHALNSRIEVQNFTIWLRVAFKKIPDTSTKPHCSQAQFTKSTYSLWNYRYAFLLRVREFWPQIYSRNSSITKTGAFALKISIPISHSCFQFHSHPFSRSLLSSCYYAQLGCIANLLFKMH